MKEISLILQNNITITVEEFRVLDRYARTGKMWTLIQKPSSVYPLLSKQRSIEYIFEFEDLTFFAMLSKNILATWDTNITKDFGPKDEYHLKDSFYIRPYLPYVPLTFPKT